MTLYSRIAGTGSYLPPKVMTNDDFAKRLDTSDAWIRERTGIASRHIADEKQTSSDLAFEASDGTADSLGLALCKVDDRNLFIMRWHCGANAVEILIR